MRLIGGLYLEYCISQAIYITKFYLVWGLFYTQPMVVSGPFYARHTIMSVHVWPLALDKTGVLQTPVGASTIVHTHVSFALCHYIYIYIVLLLLK